MKANEYKVLEEAVDEGVNWGFARVYKHHEAPTEQQVREAVKAAVMASVCDWFSLKREANN
jgi:hypothetical protein